MTDDAPVAADTLATVDDETPKCSECLNALDWRDYAYVGKQATLCKRCHQRHAKARLQGDFHPAIQMVMRNKKLVAELVRSNRVQRRASGVRNPAIPLYAPWLPQMKRGMRTLKGLRKAATLAA